MSCKTSRKYSVAVLVLAIVGTIPQANANARPKPAPQGPPAQAPQTPRAAAPQDLTGYWVSIVTEDWRFRMIVPDKGDYASVPLNPEGKKVADTWDPAKDQADGNACRSYGAAGLMRVPGRVHISWKDDNTLQVDTDSGTQTRLFHFGGSAPLAQAPEWQGYSVATWDGTAPRGGEGYLKVITTQMKPGYLRKNGVPYSANAALEEYYDTFKEPNGDIWLVVTTVVTDPLYLQLPFVTSTHFRKLPDASGWDPTSCQTNEPR